LLTRVYPNLSKKIFMNTFGYIASKIFAYYRIPSWGQDKYLAYGHPEMYIFYFAAEYSNTSNIEQ